MGFEFGEVCYWRWRGVGQEECECGEGEIVRVRMSLVVVLGCWEESRGSTDIFSLV